MSRIIENPKQLILDKGREILYNEGYSALSMRRIARACDIAIGTIYNYYPTKRELVIDMMAGYWEEYFSVLDGLMDSDYLFYEKMEKVYRELGVFIKNFKSVWLKPELYDTPDYVETGLKKEDIYIGKLIKRIQDALVKETAREGSKIKVNLGSRETAEFIVMNFITMIQMPVFKYASFEKFLKKLLE